MRAFRVSLLVLLIVLVAGGIAGLIWLQPPTQSVTLPDGSPFMLLKVTHGTNHVLRFGSRWQDFLYPVLPQKLRMKYPPRVMQFTGNGPDSVMVWFQREGVPSSDGNWPRVCLAIVDDHGLESPFLLSPHVTRTLGAPSSTTGSSAGSPGAASTQLSGWEVLDYPKRSGGFQLKIYGVGTDSQLADAGEVRIPKYSRREFPAWTAEPLPATRRSNGLDVTLTRLETGVAGAVLGAAPLGMVARVFSRATFQLRENGSVTEDWSVRSIRLLSATGITRYGDNKTAQWRNGKLTTDLWGGLWLEEPAWRVQAGFARTANFPAGDLWGIRGVPVPQPGETVEHRVVTNLHGEELEFLGISGLKSAAGTPAGKTYASIQVRTPYPLDDLSVVLVEVRDEQGRKAEARGFTIETGTGGRGITLKESRIGFRIEIPQGAEWLNITLAATQMRRVEFLAKPVQFGGYTNSLEGVRAPAPSGILTSTKRVKRRKSARPAGARRACRGDEE